MWNQMYSERRYTDLPWFSPRPYPWVQRAVASHFWARGARLLDVGCGAGTNSLFLARSGYRVSGVDIADGAIRAAQGRADAAGLKIDFRVGDVLHLPYPDGHFGGAIDIGCFHTFPLPLRSAYAREMARVIRPGRTLALAWVARESGGEEGPPHRPSVEEVAGALEEGFRFDRTEFAPGGSGRRPLRALSSYWSRLERRTEPRPPAR